MSFHQYQTTTMTVTPGARDGLNDNFLLIFKIVTAAFLAVSVWTACSRFESVMGIMALATVNGILSIVGMVRSIARQASVYFISFVFGYLFMSITPLIQMGVGDDPIFDVGSVALQALIMTTIFTCLGLYYLKFTNIPADRPAQSPTPLAKPLYLPLFVVTGAIGAVALVLFRDVLFTSRDTFDQAQVSLFGDVQTSSIFLPFLMSFPLYGAAVGLRRALQGRHETWIFLFGLLMLIAAILNNPFIHPRSALGGTLFFLTVYFMRGRGARILAVIVFSGILLAPAFQSFRYDTETAQAPAGDNENPFSQTFLSYDYDAFQLLCYTIETVDEQGIVWGDNILSSVFFFVPRAIWPGKAEQTSHYVYATMLQYRDVGTDNLSTPLIAEGYYAFWWFGALAIGILYWKLITALNNRAHRDPETFAFFTQCVLSSTCLVILRGTLIIGIGFTVSSLVCGWSAWILLRAGSQRAARIV